MCVVSFGQGPGCPHSASWQGACPRQLLVEGVWTPVDTYPGPTLPWAGRTPWTARPGFVTEVPDLFGYCLCSDLAEAGFCRDMSLQPKEGAQQAVVRINPGLSRGIGS